MNSAAVRALCLCAILSWRGGLPCGGLCAAASPAASAQAAAAAGGSGGSAAAECGAPPPPPSAVEEAEAEEGADVSLLQTSLRVTREGSSSGRRRSGADETDAGHTVDQYGHRTAAGEQEEATGFTAHLGHFFLTESPASCATWVFQKLQAWAEQLLEYRRGAFSRASARKPSSPNGDQAQVPSGEGDAGPPLVLLQEDAGVSSRRVSPVCTMLLVFWLGILAVTLLACALRVKLVDDGELPQAQPTPSSRALDLPLQPPSALCPPLVLPSSTKASFSVLLSALRRLRTSGHEAAPNGPVEVFGSSGRALLHARLSQVGSWPADSPSKSICLELTTTAVCSFPHASIGPLRIGMGTTPLLIRRGKQEAYGTLDPVDYNRWAVRHRETPLFMVDVDADHCFFTATTASGMLLASASLVKSTSALSQPHFNIQISPGADCALILLVVLATLLTSPEVCHRLAHDEA